MDNPFLLKGSATILEKNLNHLDKTMENFKMLDIKQFDASSTKETISILEEMKSKVVTIKATIEELQDIVVKTSAEGVSKEKQDLDSRDILIGKISKIEEHLGKCEKYIAEKTTSQLKDELTKLLHADLKKISAEIIQIFIKQIHLKRKEMQILYKLESALNSRKQSAENLKRLQVFEDKLHADVESGLTFYEKKRLYDLYSKDINAISADNNSRVEIRKSEILNKIYGCVLVEATHHLRQIKQSLDHYRKYAKQFAFPSKTDMFKSKYEEIKSLSNYLRDLPDDSSCVAERVELIKKQIRRVLFILREKSDGNNTLFSAMDDLASLKKDIANTESTEGVTLLDKLSSFNKHRVQKDTIVDYMDSRLVPKKMEIVLLLHSCEEKVLVHCSRDVQELKTLLNEYEKDVTNFIYPLSNEIYQQKIAEITQLGISLKTGVYRRNIDYGVANILSNTAEIIMKLLEENNTEYNKKVEWLEVKAKEVNHTLECDTISLRKKFEHLQQQVAFVKTIKNMMRKSQLVDKITMFEERIVTERNKIELLHKNDEFKKIVEGLNNITNPINVLVFNEKINQIFSLKENLEDDMSEDDKEMNSQKQNLLQQLNAALKRLDEYVAEVATKKKQSDQILESHNHFNDFIPYTFNGSRNSQHFFEIMCKRADIFEKRIQCFNSVKDSIDYCLIRENLLPLLEELNQLTRDGDNQLLPEVVEVVNYIKDLLKQLDLKCSADCDNQLLFSLV